MIENLFYSTINCVLVVKIPQNTSKNSTYSICMILSNFSKIILIHFKGVCDWRLYITR